MTDIKTSDTLLDTLRDFMSLEAAGGLLLMAAAVAAMVVANSPLAGLYDALLGTKVAIQIGALAIDKPLLLWINDGLMAIFFFLIGLEIKREVLEGELSTVSQIVLPAAGALGGMLVPAAIYAALNYGDPVALDGWAIPVATDIAFALALLGTFGTRVPTALKVFLLTLAIFDDLAAIVIIAIFYSGDLSPGALMFGTAVLALAAGLNAVGISRVSIYGFLALVLWIAVLKSGVHATLAGVLIAFCIPMRDRDGDSPLRELEHDLHGLVAFAILPIFAFANAGLNLAGVSIAELTSPVPLGITLGLLLGKPVGIMLFVGLAIAVGIARLPDKLNWLQLLGTACACGIGFTMSLFIAGLAFEHGSTDYFSADRLGIVVGSVLSAMAAWALLSVSLPRVGRD